MCSLIALIPAIITFGIVQNDKSFQAFSFSTEESSNNMSHTNISKGLEIRKDLQGYVGYVIAATGLSILTELLVVGMQTCCDCGLVNIGINIFLALVR